MFRIKINQKLYHEIKSRVKNGILEKWNIGKMER